MKNNQTTFQKILEDLTPEQKRELREAIAPEWVKAVHSAIDEWAESVQSVINDPAFWSDMFIAVLEGIAQGLAEAAADKKK
jgi:predicted Zn-dependent protease